MVSVSSRNSNNPAIKEIQRICEIPWFDSRPTTFNNEEGDIGKIKSAFGAMVVVVVVVVVEEY